MLHELPAVLAQFVSGRAISLVEVGDPSCPGPRGRRCRGTRRAIRRDRLRRDARGAESVPPGSEGLVFLPYLAGERTPHADPYVRGAFCGLSLSHGRGALTRAVLEGVAFALRDCLDTVRGAGATGTRGRVSGGGSRSRLWLEIVASALELPLEIMATDQGSAFGAALLGGVAAGVYGDLDQASAACVRVTEFVDPVDAWIEPYRGATPLPRLLPGPPLGHMGHPGKGYRAGSD